MKGRTFLDAVLARTNGKPEIDRLKSELAASERKFTAMLEDREDWKRLALEHKKEILEYREEIKRLEGA